MIPKDCKRLAEVDFPIAVVSKHSAREKSIRHGHPSTLHLWWARRPLASCRAMLMALLLPDPCDPLCPDEFKTRAKELLLHMPGWNTPRMIEQVKSEKGLRKALLSFIGDFADWDNSANDYFLSTARDLVKAAHPEETPLVVDPFAGGGSIPLEALRIGCEAFASDLNPVACLILKVMLEDIPRHGPELAEELRRVGGEIKKQAEKELAEFYPKDEDGAVPIAYLWARTVRCESPNCGAEIPLMRSFWLCKKPNRKKALQLRVVKAEGRPPSVEFEIFEPKTDKDVHGGTVTRARATCPCCNTVLPPERVRAQLSSQRGGADVIFDNDGKRIGGARMLAVVTLSPGIQGRNYRLPTERDYEAVWKAQKRLKAILDEWEKGGRKGLCPVPDEPTPAGGGSGAGRAFSLWKYGMMVFGDLFTARQKIALSVFGKNITGLPISRPLALALGKLVDLANAFCPWEPIAECPRNVLSNGSIKTSWSFAEGVTISESSGGFATCIDNLTSGLLSIGRVEKHSRPEVATAQDSPLPSESTHVWFTDPPYYDAIPYSDLSDTFFVWDRRALVGESFLRDPFDVSNPLTPKNEEAVLDEGRRVNDKPKDKAFFEYAMGLAFAEGRRVLHEDGIGSVVFAHKTTEGWEALLSGMITGEWVITASWPIATEQAHRLRARDSAALATSVHLVCRPRPEDAPVGDWGTVLRELPKRVGDWMERLQSEGIRGADLVFACIGPALEIFSRYSRVETADGSEVKLAEYLEKVWEVVGRTALEQILGTDEARARNGMAGVLEEDARLTALFLWTLQSTNGQNGTGSSVAHDVDPGEDSEVDDDEEETPKGKAKGYSLVFDVVRRFAQPLGIALPKWEGRIIETKKGVVRLMAVSERSRQLFGDDGTEAVVDLIDHYSHEKDQQLLLPEFEKKQAPRIRDRRKATLGASALEGGVMREATTLDRVHAAMLLQASGQANALRILIKAEQERGPDFLRLANALSALYPAGSEEKRLLDAMLLAAPR